MEYVEINSSLYGGKYLFSKDKSAYERDVIHCNNFENCPLYKSSQCLLAGRLINKCCKYEKVTRVKGTGPRSKSYNKLKLETEQRKDYLKLKKAEIHFCKIGEYYFFDLVFPRLWRNLTTNEYVITSPYSQPYFTANEKNIWKNLGESFNIPCKDLTRELLKNILKFEPVALFGGCIEDYQKQIVPQIKVGIKKYVPELAKECGIKKVNYIGMQGRLVTLKPPINFIDEDGFKFHYDGQFITTIEERVLSDFYTNSVFKSYIGDVVDLNVKFKPSKDLFINIENNDWVLSTSDVKKSNK